MEKLLQQATVTEANFGEFANGKSRAELLECAQVSEAELNAILADTHVLVKDGLFFSVDKELAVDLGSKVLLIIAEAAKGHAFSLQDVAAGNDEVFEKHFEEYEFMAHIVL